MNLKIYKNKQILNKQRNQQYLSFMFLNISNIKIFYNIHKQYLMINNINSTNQQKQFDKKVWIDRKLYQFKDQKDCEQTFKKHIQKKFQTDAKQVMHNLRQKLFQQHNSFSMTKQIKFQTKCSITKKRPQNQFLCIRFTTCKNYHLFDLRTIYKNFITKTNVNSPTFNCQICAAVVAKTEEIEIDILSYQFFHSTQDVAAKLIFNTQPIDVSSQTIKRAEAVQTEYEQTVFKKQNQILILKLNFIIKSAQFDKLCGNNDEISTIFQKFLNLQKQYLRQTIINDKLFEISLICPLSFRRIFNPLIHRDCKHNKIILFDLQYILMQLYKQDNPVQKLNCPQCQSFFTISNLNQIGIVDKDLRKDLYKQPTYYTNSYVEYRNFTNGSQEARIKTKVKRQLPNKVYEQQIPRIRNTVGRFWKALKYDEKTYVKNLKKITDVMSSQKEKLIINRGQIKYPVRCKWCKTLNVADLWNFVANLQCGNQKQKKICIANNCPMKIDDTNTETYLYFDFQLFKLLEHNISNVIFHKNSLKYYANIQQISTQNLIDYLKFIGHEIKPNKYYYMKNFNINFKKLGKKQRKVTQLYILQKCLKQQQPQQHIIYLQEKAKYAEKDFYCQKCKISANHINQIFIDQTLKWRFEDEDRISWNATTKEFQQQPVQIRIKISQYINQPQQLIEIVKEKKMLYVPENPTKFDILNKDGEIVQFPVYIQTCQHQKEQLLKCFFDLKCNQQRYEMKCKICKRKAEYVDELRFLSKLYQAIDNLKQQYSNTVIGQRGNNAQFKKIVNSNNGVIILNEDNTKNDNMLTSLILLAKKVQPSPTLLKSSKPQIKRKNVVLQKRIKQLRQNYPNDFDNLVDYEQKKNQNNEWDTSSILTKGGISIYNKQYLAPLVYYK